MHSKEQIHQVHPVPPHGAPTVLVVDDNELLRFTLGEVLEHSGFTVVTAANVNEALQQIATRKFDVLLSDLHMPQAGDGLTVVSAMRHSNPKAVTLILSAYPEMKAATAAILRQADEIMVKPMAVQRLVDTIQARLKGVRTFAPGVEEVGDILERETTATIVDWLQRVDREPEVLSVVLDPEERTAHLPALFRDIVSRLRHPLALGSRALVSSAASHHGLVRYEQGYTAAMMVEESRMLQVSIFQTLQNNLDKVNFSRVLVGVMAIADEVDSQLAQAMSRFVAEAKMAAGPVVPGVRTISEYATAIAAR